MTVLIRRRQSIARRTATARPVVDTDRTARTAGIPPLLADEAEVCMSAHSSIAADRGPAAREASCLRRQVLLGGAGVSLGAALGTSGLVPVAPAAAQAPTTEPHVRPIDSAMQRRALEIRQACARQASEMPIAPHPTNGDEARYTNKIGSDSRGLPHDKRGEVEQAAWQALYTACQSGDPADFEKIPLGGPRKLVNPVGTLAVSLSGINPTQIAIPPAPALASAERGGEAVEVYWQSLL